MTPDEKKDFDIDRNDLDGEWIRQAGLYAYYADKYADALRKRNSLWLDKKILKAKLYKEHRLLLTVDGKAPTDTRTDNEIHADPRYEKASRALIDAEVELEKMDGFKWAMEHKKKGLDKVSDNADRSGSMPDSYQGKRDAAIERKREESEDFDRQQRESLTAKKGIRR
jgi:hypothetical protein